MPIKFLLIQNYLVFILFLKFFPVISLLIYLLKTYSQNVQILDLVLFLMLFKNVVSPFFIFFMDGTLDQKLGLCFQFIFEIFHADNVYSVISHNSISSDTQ